MVAKSGWVCCIPLDRQDKSAPKSFADLSIFHISLRNTIEKYTVEKYSWEIQGKHAQKSFAFGRSKHLSIFGLFGQRIWSLMFWLDTDWSRECIWIYIQPYSYFINQLSFGGEERTLIFINSGWKPPPRTDQIWSSIFLLHSIHYITYYVKLNIAFNISYHSVLHHCSI